MTATDHDVLTGTTERHLVPLGGASSLLVHAQVVEPLEELQALAASQGFDLQVCSGFRSFDRQMIIWNEKVKGIRSTLDHDGRSLSLDSLNAWQKIQAIMRWSALPGASRHHWGTDMDIYDAAAMPEGYQIQLTPDEVQGAGIFSPMHNWLDSALVADNSALGFYRPYGKDRGGVAPERWHISYAPLADIYAQRLSSEVIAQQLRGTDLLLLDEVVTRLNEIVERFVRV